MIESEKFVPMYRVSTLIILILVLGRMDAEAQQQPFPPGSIWEFVGTHSPFPNYFAYHWKIEATNKDTLLNGQIWQILKNEETTYYSIGDTSITKYFDDYYRRQGHELIVHKIPGLPDECTAGYLLDANIGDTIYYDATLFVDSPKPRYSVIDVDTVLVSGEKVQQIVFEFEQDPWWEKDTVEFWPLIGAVFHKNEYKIHLHEDRPFFLFPYYFGITDYNDYRLACFTFANGERVELIKDCGGISAIQDHFGSGPSFSLAISPNPASSSCLISWHGSFEGNRSGVVQLIDLNGRVILEQPVDLSLHKTFVDLPSDVRGVHLIRVHSASGQFVSGVFIIE